MDEKVQDFQDLCRDDIMKKKINKKKNQLFLGAKDTTQALSYYQKI